MKPRKIKREVFMRPNPKTAEYGLPIRTNREKLITVSYREFEDYGLTAPCVTMAVSAHYVGNVRSVVGLDENDVDELIVQLKEAKALLRRGGRPKGTRLTRAQKDALMVEKMNAAAAEYGLPTWTTT